MTKPTLKNIPSVIDAKLLADYAAGTPIAPDLVNFLYRHEKSLSTHGFDPILKYYLKPHYRKLDEAHHSFLMPNEKLSKNNLSQLKSRLELFLKGNQSHVEFHLTPEEFTLLKQAGIPELILYHGNQFLTGAPYYLGGIPHVIFFQWGNLFGVAKYVMLPEERALKSNLLIYVEDMHDRYLQQCVNDYMKAHRLENQAQEIKQTYAHSPYKIPTLTLAIHTNKGDEKE